MFRHEGMKLKGNLEVWGVRNGVRTLDHQEHNAIWVTLQTNLRNVLVNRSVEYGVDAIAWGSFSAPGGTFVDSSWAGTTSSGTQGGMIQSSIGTTKAKFSGTFTFSTTKQINYFELGRGYTAAGAGVSALFTGRYAYDNSLNTGSTWLTYENGDSFVVDWTIQLGP
jgi:hypothetical protein